MKKIIFILFLLLSLQYIVAADKAPLYILDGQYVQSEKNNIVENISPDDIATIQTLDSATAVGLYGERAAGGAVIVRTWKFEAENFKQPREESTNIKEQRKNPKKDRDILVLILIVLLSTPLSKWLIKWYTKGRAHLKEKNIIEPQGLPSYLKNAESIQFKATSSFRYYIWIVLMTPFVIGFTSVIFCAVIPEMMNHPEDWGNVLLLVLLSIIDIMAIIATISLIMNHKWHLTINEKGIRGMYQDSYKGLFFPVFTKVNIRWESVSSAELVHRMPAGRGLPIAGLAVFYKSKPETPKEIININLFPTRKIIESVNYFYALHQERNSLAPKELMDTYKHKDDEKFRLVINFATCIILVVIYLVIVQF
jgi:hypothetical protein